MDKDQVSLGISAAAFLICITNLIFTLIAGRTKKAQNIYFIIITTILSVNAISGIIICALDPYIIDVDEAFEALCRARFLYFLTHTALCPLFYCYMSSVCDVTFSIIRRRKKRDIFVIAASLISEILVITNPFTGYTWYYGQDREFTRGWGEMVIYVFSAAIYVITFIIMTHSWTALTKARKYALGFSFLFAISGVIIQLLFHDIRVEILFEAIGFTGVMMAVENEEDKTDVELGAYNRAALALDIDGCIRSRNPMLLVVIRVINSDVIGNMIGSQNVVLLYRSIVKYLASKVKSYQIYTTSPGTFAVALYNTTLKQRHNKSPEEWAMEFAERIRRHFERPWHLDDRTLPLETAVMLADIPNGISDVSQVFYMIDSPIPADLEKNVISGKDLDYLLRREAVEKAVSRGLAENSFEVYYQPTYNIDKSIHGAEALLRMHDSEIGDIYPDEFIPITEQLNLIDDVDEFVLKEVCSFVKSGIPLKLGLDSINVNLSVIQCMKEGFVDHINSIVEEYDIDKSFINFEITESVAANDYKLLSKVIRHLKLEGFRFSIDDYGTGYSNMTSVFSLNIDVIKIDKSILWGAEKTELGYVILENSIRMIRQMKRKILVEGVETPEQIDILSNLDVDYLQGFFFSKPLPKKDFIELLEKQGF